MSAQPSVDRAHVSLATAYPPCGRRPTESGRKPHGSRTAITWFCASSTSEKAPFHAGSVRSSRSSQVRPPAAASISAITSVSLVAVSPKPAREQLVAQRRGVDDVAVVGDGERAVHRLDEERLDVALGVGAGGRVARVADRVVAGERRQHRRREDVGDQPLVLVEPGPLAVADGDAGCLLPTMLEREQPEERHLGHPVAVRRRDPDHPALLSRAIDAVDRARAARDVVTEDQLS